MTARLLAVLAAAVLSPASAAAAPTAASMPTSAADMNTRTAAVEGWRSGDSGRTVKLADGRLISFFGDSTLADGTFVHNSAVFFAPDRTYLAAATLFPDFPDGSRFWPGQAVAVGQRVFLVGSRQLVRGAFDWTPLGSYLAIVDVPWGGKPIFRKYVLTPSSGQGDEAVQWYGGLAICGSTVYLHGVRDRADDFHIRDGGYVARAPLYTLGQLAGWRYWTGSGWSADPAAAAATIPADGAGGTESGYTLHRRPDGSWQVTTRQYGGVGDHLGRYVGASPWGPWKPFEPLLAVSAGEGYLTGAVSGVLLASGRLLVQWSRPGLPVEWAEVPQ